MTKLVWTLDDGKSAAWEVPEASIVPEDATVSPLVLLADGTNGIAISPDGKTVYAVSTTPSGVLIPIDVASLDVGTPIPVGDNPEGVAITPDGKKAYVCNISDGSVTPINLETQTPGDAIELGTATTSLIAITPDGTRAYVTNGDGNLSVIDTETDTVIATVAVADSLYAIAITPDGSTVYVSDNSTEAVYPIPVATNVPGAPFNVGTHPVALIITADGRTMYVANYNDATVVPIALPSHELGTPIGVGSGPEAFAFSPDGKTLYVSASGDNAVDYIDVESGVWVDAITVTAGPEYLVASPDGKRLFVTQPGGTGVQVLNIENNSNIVPVTVPAFFIGDLAVIAAAYDPTVTTMDFALPGSIYMRSNGTVYWRTGPDVAGWSAVGSGGGGGLALTGWTEDASDPANLASNGGNLDLGAGSLSIESGEILIDNFTNFGEFRSGAAVVGSDSGAEGAETYAMRVGHGVTAAAPPGTAAFTALTAAGATVAFDANGLAIINWPTVDPHIEGALWNNAGVPTFSSG